MRQKRPEDCRHDGDLGDVVAMDGSKNLRRIKPVMDHNMPAKKKRRQWLDVQPADMKQRQDV